MEKDYKKNSISLLGAIFLGTGVMISAGIFALTGQIAELSSKYFPIILIIGSIVTYFSAYSYIKFSQHYPSAGGIGMYLVEAYGKGVIASTASLMMIVSMIINQSLVARTFGSYLMTLFNQENNMIIIPALGVGLLIFSLIINLSGNAFIQGFTGIMSIVKIVGIILFSLGALYASGFVISFSQTSSATANPSLIDAFASIALAILAFKGFTTITNNGKEIVKPKKNVAKAIIFSILISLIVYLSVAFGVSGNLTVSEIIESKDYALAEAARPLFSGFGLYFTVSLAIIATITAIIASVFAVSRLIAMLADMGMIPHKQINENVRTQKQTLFYTVILAIILTIFFDLSRIASLGAILYIAMDIVIHVGLAFKKRKDINAKQWIVLSAIILDALVLSAFIYVKLLSDPFIVLIAIGMILALIVMEIFFFKSKDKSESNA
ncbi:MAG: APC family permease [Candidatus Izemoplasmataceae bacterium]